MGAMGYQPVESGSDDDTGLMEKDLLGKAKPELKELLKLLDELGLPQDYGIKHRMRFDARSQHPGADWPGYLQSGSAADAGGRHGLDPACRPRPPAAQ